MIFVEEQLLIMCLIFRLMQVTSPGGNTVHNLKGTSGDKFEFKAPRSGMYKFCFHNPYSTPETVSFYIHVGHIPTEHDLAKDGLLYFPWHILKSISNFFLGQAVNFCSYWHSTLLRTFELFFNPVC